MPLLLVMLAIGSVLSAVVPFIPDLKLIIYNGIMLLFFLSGIFFYVSAAPPEIQTYLYLNPMVSIIDNYRQVLLDGAWPDWSLIGTVSLISLCCLATGLYLLHRFDRIYVKVI